MSLDIWMDALCDGRKGDTLMLYGLSMILDVHTVVHLRNGKIWTMMDSLPDEHSDLISKCLIHAVYLGRGLFVELVKRDKPLEVIKSKNGALSYVVGELTIMEQESFDKTLRTGLSVSMSNETVPVDLSVPHNKSIENEPSENSAIDLTINLTHRNNQATDYLEPSTSKGIAKELMVFDENVSMQLAKPTTDQSTTERVILSGENKYPYMDILGKMSLKVSVQKYKVTSEMQTIHITQNLMDNLPTSKYRKGWDTHIPADEGAESDTTLIYWLLSDDSDSDHVRSDPLIASTSRVSRKKPTFNINWHGLHQRKPRYWFKCKVSTCDSTFSTIHGWNFHHSYVHRNITLKCEIYGQKFTSPSAHHAHKSAHVPQTNICTICNKAFPFKSGLRQHMIVHIKQKRHRCFAGNCKRLYKWASDLNCHVKTHIDRRHRCPDCDYSSREERLFKRHLKKHIDEFKYRCMYCIFKTKWPTPFKQHIIRCKAKYTNE